MPQQRAIAIIGGTLWGNRGAEAMLVTTIGEIRKRNPNTTFYVYSYFPKEDRKIIRDPHIRIFSARPWALVLQHFTFAFLCWVLGLFRLRYPEALLPRSVRCLRDCDGLLDINGISFSDGREKFLPFNIMMIWPAMLLKVPVIKLSQAMGPFKNPLNHLSANLFLRRCHYVYARGTTTASYLQQFGLKREKYSTATDIAFLYSPEYSLTRENDDRLKPLVSQLQGIHDEKQLVIGLIPSSVVYAKAQKQGQDYLGGFLKLIADLGEKHHFIFLPNATREGRQTSRNNDIFVIDALRQRARYELSSNIFEGIDWVDFDINTAGSRDLIAMCDVLITSRFHGMISGLSLGVPTAVIGWSHKYKEIMVEFNVEEFAVDFSKPDLANQIVQKLIDQAPSVRQKLAAGLSQVREASLKQFDDLESLLS